MGTLHLNMDDFNPQTDSKTCCLELPVREYSIAFIKDEVPVGNFTLMSPDAIKELTDNNVQVWMQHGFAANTGYTDMDYAKVGVEFIDDFVVLAHSTKLLVKFMPFTIQQLDLMKDAQIIFSTQQPVQIDASYIRLLNQKKITALAMNFIHDAHGVSMTDKILTESLSAAGVTLSMSTFLLPLLMSIILNNTLRIAMLSAPSLMQSAYCYKGFLCNEEIARQLNLPWKDILSLCWDMN